MLPNPLRIRACGEWSARSFAGRAAGVIALLLLFAFLARTTIAGAAEHDRDHARADLRAERSAGEGTDDQAARGERALESEDGQGGRVPVPWEGGATKQYPQRYERVAPTKKSAALLVRSPSDFRHGLQGGDR